MTELNARERCGRRIQLAALTVIGAPLVLFLLPGYLREARAGLSDRRAPFTMSAVAVSMIILPLFLLLVFNLAGLTTAG